MTAPTAKELEQARRLYEAARVFAAEVSAVRGYQIVSLGAGYPVGVVRAFAAVAGGAAVRPQPYAYDGAVGIIESVEARLGFPSGTVTLTIQGTRPATAEDLARHSEARQ